MIFYDYLSYNYRLFRMKLMKIMKVGALSVVLNEASLMKLVIMGYDCWMKSFF